MRGRQGVRVSCSDEAVSDVEAALMRSCCVVAVLVKLFAVIILTTNPYPCMT